MMSENSFLVRLLANFKRRIWVIALTCVCCLFSTLGILITYYSRINSYNEKGIYVSIASFQLALRQATSDCLVFSNTISVVTVILAVIIALQGFSYLHNRSKLDFYMSQPVSASKRFHVIVIGSFIIYTVPMLISIGLSLIYAATSHALSAAVLSRALISLIDYILLFAAIYFTVLLAVMLTGNMTMAILGSFVFIIYEIAIRETLDALMSIFLATHDYSFEVAHGYISPLQVQQHIWGLHMNYTNAPLPTQQFSIDLLLLFANALVFAIIARICYSRRDGQAAGKSLVFNWTRGPIKIIVGTIASLVFTMILLNFVEYSIFSAIVFIIIASLLIGAVIQFLLDGSIASCIEGLPSTLCICALTLIIIGGFHWDILGYDKYTPDADDLVSYAIAFHCDANSGNWYDCTQGSNPNYVDAYQYIKDNLYMTDTETIVQLAQCSIRDTSSVEYDGLGQYRDYSVLYRLKNGQTVARHMWVDLRDETTRKILAQIMGNKDYITTSNPTINALGEANLPHIYDVSYICNGTEQKLHADVNKIYDALKADLLNNYSFDLVSSELPCGTLNIRYNRYYYSPVNIYPAYTRVISLLEADGIKALPNIVPEDVAYIEITQNCDIYRDEFGNEIAAASEEGVIQSSERLTQRYTDLEDIAAILDNIVLSCQMTNYWYNTSGYDLDTDVLISLKNDVTKDNMHHNDTYGYFVKDEIPDFILEDFAN